ALVYLSDCVAKSLADAQTAALEAGVMLNASLPDQLPAVLGDAKRVTKALSHLVSNAIKFTPQGGAAMIRVVHSDHSTLALEVLDAGLGMPPEARDKIWQAFTQYDGRPGRRYEGVGLGLTYVGKVAELHEAAVDILSEQGKGTCVRLIFQPHRLVREL